MIGVVCYAFIFAATMEWRKCCGAALKCPGFDDVLPSYDTCASRFCVDIIKYWVYKKKKTRMYTNTGVYRSTAHILWNGVDVSHWICSHILTIMHLTCAASVWCRSYRRSCTTKNRTSIPFGPFGGAHVLYLLSVVQYPE